MKQLLKAVALSTFCLAVSACGGPEVRFKSIPTPAERMDCVAVDKSDRPKLGALHTIDWSKVATVPQAQAEVTKLLASVFNRELTAAEYILKIEDQLFLCASDAEWLRDFNKNLEK